MPKTKKVPVPGQVHPDVRIVESVLRETKPGEVCSYAAIEAALGITRKERAFVSRCRTARRQLADEIAFVAVPGEGFLRETGVQSVERVAGPEKKRLSRQFAKNQRVLATVELASLPPELKHQAIMETVRQNLLSECVSKRASVKLLRAVQTSGEVIAVTRALEFMKNGESDK